MRWTSPEDGATLHARGGSGDGIRTTYKITRANGKVEIHVVDVSKDSPEGNYPVTTLNKGDTIETVFPFFHHGPK